MIDVKSDFFTELVCSKNVQNFLSLELKEQYCLLIYNYPQLNSKDLFFKYFTIANSAESDISQVTSSLVPLVLLVQNDAETSKTSTTSKTSKLVKIENTQNELDRFRKMLTYLNTNGYLMLLKGDKWDLDIKGKELAEKIKIRLEREENKAKLGFMEQLAKKSLHEQLYDFCMDKEIEQEINLHILNKGKFELLIDLKKEILKRYDFVEQIITKPEEMLDLIKKGLSINDFGQKEGSELQIKITGVPKGQHRTINEIRAVDIDSLIYIEAEIISRSNSSINIQLVKYECPQCGATVSLIQEGFSLKQPQKCNPCGYKGKFSIIKYKFNDAVKLKVKDRMEDILPDQYQEDINMIVSGVHDFSLLKEGDVVRFTGYVKLIEQDKDDVKMKKRIQPKVFIANNFEKISQSFTIDKIKPEDLDRIKEIAQKPFKNIYDIVCPDLEGIQTQMSFLFCVVVAEKPMHILNAGEPGTGKTEGAKRVGNFVKSKFIDITNASASGVIGTISKDQFTGRWSLDGGNLAQLNPGGVAILDELNRDEKGNLQRVILGVMGNGEINLNKAGNRIKKECKISIVATCNPELRLETVKLWENFRLLPPVWDRFDYILFFNDKPNYADKKLIQRLLAKKDKFVLTNEDNMLMRKYFAYCKSFKVTLDDRDYEKLAELMKEFIERIDPNASFRKLRTIENTLIAIAKLHLCEKPTDEHYKQLKFMLEAQAFALSEYRLSLKEDNWRK